MKTIAAKVDSFLEEWQICAESVDIQQVCSSFLAEMEKGLKGPSSLAMIPTYVEAPQKVSSNQRVIVLDAGGTNVRSCVVFFDAQMKPHISDFRKTGMPGAQQEVSERQFFSALADMVEPLIHTSDRIGFCFSYAAEITDDHDGIPLGFSKEIKAPSVVGKRVGKGLLDELHKRGYHVENKRISVINDTVATLLAGRIASLQTPYESYIGFILGTGTNTAYIETNSVITKKPHLGPGQQIINVESGGFAYDLGPLDRLFVQATERPQFYHFEKMISGAYLGSFSHLCIQKAVEQSLFSPTFANRFATLPPLDTMRMSHYLERPWDKEVELVRCIANEEDATALWMICDAVIERAAKLTAANLSAAVLKSDFGKSPRAPVCINADGTTYYKTKGLQTYTEYYMHQFLTKTHRRYATFVTIDNSPVLGAGVAGLLLD